MPARQGRDAHSRPSSRESLPSHPRGQGIPRDVHFDSAPLLVAAILSVVPAVARAQDATPDAATQAPATQAAQSDATRPGPTPKHPIPDYDGRGPEPVTAGDVALWSGRVVLSPLYLVSEYVLRRPLALAITAAEQADVPRKLYDFFTFGPNHNIGFAPVSYFDFGFNPSAGVYAFWNDAGFAGDDWHVHLEAWPDDWVGVSLTDRMQLDKARALEMRVALLRRPDHVFYGIGPDSPQAHQSRYGEDRIDAGATYEWRFWRSSRLQTAAGLLGSNLYEGHYGWDPSLGAEAATGAFPLPPGFGTGFAAEYNRVALVLDSRRPWPAPGSGLRADLSAQQENDLRQSPASGWIRYGGSIGGYLDLNDRGRVLGVGATTMFVDPLGSGFIPFPELATLGGDGPMRGYYPGRLLGRSAAAAEVHYVWPIAAWLGGTFEAAVGNVFDAHLAGFDVERLRFSGDIGISSLGSGDYPIEAIAGIGSEPFDRGGSIDSVHVSLSVNHGF